MAIWSKPEKPLCLNFHLQIVRAQNDEKPTNYRFLKKLQPNKVETVFLENWLYETKYLSQVHMIKLKIVFWNFRKQISQTTNSFEKFEARNRAYKLEINEIAEKHFFVWLATAFKGLSKLNRQQAEISPK